MINCRRRKCTLREAVHGGGANAYEKENKLWLAANLANGTPDKKSSTMCNKERVYKLRVKFTRAADAARKE
jgi:hypothetical protein